MYSKSPKYRRKLNEGQLEILRLLYKFRFGSRDLMAMYFGKKNIYPHLLVLEDRGFIGKKYEPRHKLAGKPAAYFLTPAGFRELQENYEDIEELHIKKLYKAKDASDAFIAQSLTTLAFAVHLKQTESDAGFFTRTDLQKDKYDYFPAPLPHAYIRAGNQQYFVNVFDASQPFFAIIKRIKLLNEYYENGRWDDTGTEFPIVLIVLEDSKGTAKVSRYIGTIDLNVHLLPWSKLGLPNQDAIK